LSIASSSARAAFAGGPPGAGSGTIVAVNRGSAQYDCA
jgi:hypothetical protein